MPASNPPISAPSASTPSASKVSRFYEDLVPFRRFADACKPDHYVAAPDDWHILLTDVAGSTKAIQQGRYKQVNMVGAACITAAQNTCKGIRLPYVFGGDGATLLVPPTYVDAVIAQLLAVQTFAQRMHGLSLRVGNVPISEVYARGKQVRVAKYHMETSCEMAMFRGGGLGLADDLVKHEGYVVEANDGTQEPDLDGLSCRWHPIKTSHGSMLSLLVLVLNDGADNLYSEINQRMADIIGHDGTPAIPLTHLRYQWPGWHALRNARMVWQRGNIVKQLLGHIGMITLFHVLHLTNGKLGNFDVVQYRKDMLTNSDFRKFDDMLRMVVDCTPEQLQQIEQYLADLHARGHIVYGMHQADSALMTCLVTSTASDGHIHFIDGNDGGYALAATQLKQQLAEHAV